MVDDSWPSPLRMPPLPSSLGQILPVMALLHDTPAAAQPWRKPLHWVGLHVINLADLAGVCMTLKRIEDAIARLEAATQQSAPGLAQLQASNIRLREAIASSISQIDAVIAQHGGDPQT